MRRMVQGRELHAGLTECITGREVVRGVDLDGDHTLAALDTSGRTDVLSKRTSHALRNTVCTGTRRLLVFTEHVVGEGVDAKGIALCAGLLTDGGVGNDTSGFESGVANLNIVIGAKFENDLELARLRSTWFRRDTDGYGCWAHHRCTFGGCRLGLSSGGTSQRVYVP